MNVLWSAASVRQFQEAFDYLEGESSGRAITVRRRILEAVERIGLMPFSGHVGRVEGTREAFVPRTHYIVVYRISAQAVDILGIWHTSRQWPESF